MQAEEAEQAEDPPEEPFNTGAFAEFCGSPGRGKTGTIALPLGIPGDDLTELGRSIEPVLRQMCGWGEWYSEEMGLECQRLIPEVEGRVLH